MANVHVPYYGFKTKISEYDGSLSYELVNGQSFDYIDEPEIIQMTLEEAVARFPKRAREIEQRVRESHRPEEEPLTQRKVEMTAKQKTRLKQMINEATRAYERMYGLAGGSPEESEEQIKIKALVDSVFGKTGSSVPNWYEKGPLAVAEILLGPDYAGKLITEYTVRATARNGGAASAYALPALPTVLLAMVPTANYDGHNYPLHGVAVAWRGGNFDQLVRIDGSVGNSPGGASGKGFLRLASEDEIKAISDAQLQAVAERALVVFA